MINELYLLQPFWGFWIVFALSPLRLGSGMHYVSHSVEETEEIQRSARPAAKVLLFP